MKTKSEFLTDFLNSLEDCKVLSRTVDTAIFKMDGETFDVEIKTDEEGNLYPYYGIFTETII